MSAWIDLTLGVVLVLFAIVVARRRPTGPKAVKERKELGFLALFLVGCLMYSPAPLYLASLHAVVKLTRAANSWLAEHSRTVIVIVAGGFGCCLLGSGIDHLVR